MPFEFFKDKLSYSLTSKVPFRNQNITRTLVIWAVCPECKNLNYFLQPLKPEAILAFLVRWTVY